MIPVVSVEEGLVDTKKLGATDRHLNISTALLF